MSRSRIKTITKEAESYVLIEDNLYKRGKDDELRMSAIEEEYIPILEQAHFGQPQGHFSIDKTAKEIFIAGIWWPTLFMDGKEYVKRCDDCQRTKTPRGRDDMPLRPMMVAIAFEKWGLDLVGPIAYVSYHTHAQYTLVPTVSLTKWVKAKATIKIDAKTIARFCIRIYSPDTGPNLKESATNSQFLKGETKIEEESGLSADFSSAEPELAGGNEIKLASKPSSVTSSMPSKSQGFVLPMPVGPSLEDVEKVMTAETDFGQDLIPAEDLNRKNHVLLDHRHLSDIDDAAQFTQSLDSQGLPVKDIPKKLIPPLFLTCEDLEQSLLSECVHSGSGKKVEDKQIDMDNNVNLMQLLQLGTRNKGQGLVTEQESGDSMDGNASTHLMTLLQKNAGSASPLEDSTSIISAETSSHSMGQNDPVEDQCFAAEIISLETLFGRKFVNELRSVGEPVSSKQIVDDSMQENLLNSILFNKNQSRQPGHADVPFHEQAGWNYDGFLVTQPKSSEIISGSHLQDLQADLSTGMSVHRPTPMKALKNTSPSREVLVNGAPFSDFSQRKFSHHPYHGSRGQQLEGHHHPPSEIISHRSIHEPHLMQENPLYAMGMHAFNSSLLSPFQGQFLRAGNSHLPGHFEEASSVQEGIHRVVSAVSAGYPESIQMGFNPSQGMSDPRITGSRISPLADRWFPGGDHNQGSQGIAGPYQHQMIQERKPGFGIPGLGSGPDAQNYNVGLPSDRRGQAEKSYDHYILSNSRPGYG
ncbi:hypothetical protein L7F22_015544 [Adiantum nelumboides]|nr:hypothetical protein [Adiantum nelumboides]